MVRLASRTADAGPRMPRGDRTRCRIEDFHDSQLGELFAIESLSFGEDSYREEFFRRLCLDNRDLLLVARKGARLAGYVMGEQQESGVEIISLAVHPDLRGCGLGRVLLQRLLDRARRRGMTRFSLMVRADNPVAMNLYLSVGFRRVRRVPAYYMDGQDGIRMKLALED